MNTKRRSIVRQPIRTESYVWCDYHCEIHPAKTDYYNDAVDDACCRKNWRSVYVLGEPGEEF